MKKVLIVLPSLVVLVAVYVWFSGIRISFTPNYTITAVNLYATEADSSAARKTTWYCLFVPGAM